MHFVACCLDDLHRELHSEAVLQCWASIKISEINRVGVVLTPVCWYDRALLPLSPTVSIRLMADVSLPSRLPQTAVFSSPDSALCCFSIFSRRPSKESIFILIWVSSRLIVWSWSVFTVEAQTHRVSSSFVVTLCRFHFCSHFIHASFYHRVTSGSGRNILIWTNWKMYPANNGDLLLPI